MTTWLTSPPPKDGQDIDIQPEAGYNTAFYHDGWWWYYNRDKPLPYHTYAVGPTPHHWNYLNLEAQQDIHSTS